MVTSVGTEDSFEKLVKNLLILEHDAIAAYDKTAEKLEDAMSKAKILEFREDHLSHVAYLTRMARELGTEAPQEGDMKEYLTVGKVSFASLIGDKTILKAMSTNEIETKMAYDQASKNPVATPAAKAFFQEAFVHESRHKDWMDAAAAGDRTA